MVAACVRGGVDWIQIREREWGGAQLHDCVRVLADAARAAALPSGRSVSTLVNRRIDVAWAAGADGVHLGFDAVAPDTARRLLGPEARVGVSTHAEAEIAASARSVDYCQLAPVFAPLSKASTRPPLGIEALRAACRRGVPVLAQGGVTAQNAGALAAAGAAGVAVTGSLLGAEDPERAAAALRAGLDGAHRVSR